MGTASIQPPTLIQLSRYEAVAEIAKKIITDQKMRRGFDLLAFLPPSLAAGVPSDAADRA